jgi:hypothetical protein
VLVYVKEAHPGDGDWPMPVPGRGMLNEPIGETARAVRATECVKELALDRYTVVVDDVSDTVNRAFAAWPERLAVIDVDGTLAFLFARCSTEERSTNDRGSGRAPNARGGAC